MKHILHVIQSLEFGGAEKVVVQLANKFSDEYKITVCVTKAEGKLTHELNDKVALISLNMGEGNNPKLVKRLRGIISERQIDVVHCHDWGVFIEGAFATKKSPGVHLVLTAHGPYTDYAPGFISEIKKTVRHGLERYLAKSTFRFVGVSSAIKAYMLADIGLKADKVSVIHNGIEGYEPSGGKKPERCRKFITVGRIAPVKNHQLMLNAFSQAIKTHDDITLTVVGDGPEFSRIKQYAEKLGLLSHVEFTGFRSDIEDILREHDVFLLSSIYEGISIAGLEAMSLGMPVISTDVGGMSEMISQNKTGMLVEKNNANEYARALQSMCNDNELFIAMGLESRKHYDKNFRESITLNKYRQLYEQV